MKIRLAVVMFSCAISGLSADARAAPAVQIEEAVIGFDGLYRCGRMVPVFVAIRNTLTVPFEGQLQAEQGDDDGDRMRWRTDAILGPKQRQWRMVLICPRPEAIERGDVTVSVIDAGGTQVDGFSLAGTDDKSRQLLRRRPMAMPAGRRVVGVVGSSTGVFGRLSTPDNRSEAKAHTTEPMYAVAVPIQYIPAMWQGLDMLDVLYWDDPRPQALDADQQRAIAQWVRRGGQLVVGLGAGAQQFVSDTGELTELLPVQMAQIAQQVDDLHSLGEALLGKRYRNQLARGASVVDVHPKKGAWPWVGPGNTGRPLLYRWARGAGSVTVMCTTLQGAGLAEAPWPFEQALAALVGVRTLDTPVSEQFPSLIGRVFSSQLDSAGVGGLLVGLVALMTIAYALATGPGTWFYACLKGRRHQSWWLFAAAALAATAGSVMLSLFSIRGASVSNALILDLPAGSSYGVVQGYFGLYVPAHRMASVQLQDDPYGQLVPMINPERSDTGGYPDVRSYDLHLADMGTASAPIRRTIKRFAMTWVGDISRPGGGLETVEGSMQVAPVLYESKKPGVEPTKVWEISGSVTNNLPVDLTEAVLIYACPNQEPSESCRVVKLGQLGSGKTVTFDSGKLAQANNIADSPVLTLKEFHEDLCKRLGLRAFALEGPMRVDFLSQVQLMTTLGLYDQPSTMQEDPGPLLVREALSRLDRSDQLRPGRAMLIAKATAYMPAKIKFDSRNTELTGPTVVRVLFDVAGAR
ncbi:MAG: hypothetical protein HQ546_00190 [Planctomycetes bacterium]|nr:hypothetical protein [Planctomycetota bacterium]